MRHLTKFMLIGLLAASLLASCDKPKAAPPQDVQAVSVAATPADPNDAAWSSAPEYIAKLLPQDLVEPRQLTPSTAEVRVRAIVSGSDLAVRLQWADATDDNVTGPGNFSDGCAIQVPAKVEPGIPAPQMGEPGKPVEIVFWNASWQAETNGRGDSINALYPNASIDHYPYEAASLAKGSDAQKAMATRYAPARAVGNPFAGPHSSAVQDLVAQGPGTLAAAPANASRGRGARTADGWSVVVIRKLPPGLTATTPTQIAFAIWDGAGGGRGTKDAYRLDTAHPQGQPMTTTPPTDFTSLLQDAAEWRLIAMLLERPNLGWAEQIAALAKEIPDGQLRLAAATVPDPAETGLYDTTFGPGGPAPPREVSYRACLDGNFLAELAAFYNAFAYQPTTDDPPDHVAVEAGFVSYLRFKQLYALSRGDDERADIAARTARRIIDDHLSIIAVPLAESLQASNIEYLARAAAALLQRVGPPRHASLPIPVIDESCDTRCATACDVQAETVLE